MQTLLTIIGETARAHRSYQHTFLKNDKYISFISNGSHNCATFGALKTMIRGRNRDLLGAGLFGVRTLVTLKRPLHLSRPALEPTNILYNRFGGSVLGMKRFGCGVDHSLPSSNSVTNHYGRTSTVYVCQSRHVEGRLLPLHLKGRCRFVPNVWRKVLFSFGNCSSNSFLGAV